MYLIKVAKRAEKSVLKMPSHYQKRVKALLKALEEDAVPTELYDIKKLEGREGEYRVRIGDIRILYAVFWNSESIEITDISWRGQAYK